MHYISMQVFVWQKTLTAYLWIIATLGKLPLLRERAVQHPTPSTVAQYYNPKQYTHPVLFIQIFLYFIISKAVSILYLKTTYWLQELEETHLQLLHCDNTIMVCINDLLKLLSSVFYPIIINVLSLLVLYSTNRQWNELWKGKLLISVLIYNRSTWKLKSICLMSIKMRYSFTSELSLAQLVWFQRSTVRTAAENSSYYLHLV